MATSLATLQRVALPGYAAPNYQGAINKQKVGGTNGTRVEVVKRFRWVTDIDLSKKVFNPYQGAGRCRWRVENETFNTLKNQGYCLEHNYGHGSDNLTTVITLLMFLAFAVDQIQEACCDLFVAAMKHTGRRIRLWESIRSHLRHFEFASFAELYTAIAAGTLTKPPPVR